MSFSKYTCPIIDENIISFKSELYDLVSSIIEDVSPMLSETSLGSEYIDTKCVDFYNSVSDLFENIRSTNETLRSEAESIISDLNAKLDDYRTITDKLENEVYELNYQINNRENKCFIFRS